MRWIKVKFIIVLIALLGFIVFVWLYTKSQKGVILPRPFMVAIDDLGWMQGSSLYNKNGPDRAGVRHDFELFDYKALVQVADSLNIRLQCLFVLAEMDKYNDCASVPSSTQMGDQWENPNSDTTLMNEIMAYVYKKSAYLEFGLHGVCHEFWDDSGKISRGEWYDIENNLPRKEGDIVDHIELFSKIMSQYSFNEKNGHSFPESFVACNHGYYWNPYGDYSMGKVLNQFGVKYANSSFYWIEELKPPLEEKGGFDNGVLFLHRENEGNAYNAISAVPSENYWDYKTDVIESHFVNWLAPDYYLQEETNTNWIDFYNNIQKSTIFYISKNTEQFYSQWLYKKYTKLKNKRKGLVIIDNTEMVNEAYKYDILKNLVFKIKLPEDKHVSSATLNDSINLTSYYEDQDFAFLVLPKLKKTQYKLRYKLSDKKLSEYIDGDGTFNIYSFKPLKNKIEFEIKLYGTQNVHVISENKGNSVDISNRNVELLNINYTNGQYILKLKAKNIQGEEANITIHK